MFLLLGAFIAGILTVLAPCVLPLLPIIIGGSVSVNEKYKKRPIIIAASLAISLIVFTLLLKATTLLINIPPNSINYFSGGIIVLLGLVTLFPGIYALIIAKLGIEQRTQKILGKGYNNKRSFIGPLITGAALGPVFSSCSPVYAYILATVLPANFAQAMVYIVAYVLGLSLFLLIIGYYGQGFIGKIKFAANPRGTFQRVIAVLFIVVGLSIATGFNVTFQTHTIRF
jgi:cytochrome c-type biogenesis protein